MAYSRKRFTTRRYKKKPAWYNRKYNAMQLAAKAWKGVRYIRGLVNSEMFYKDTTATIGGAQSNITSLTDIAVGDGTSSRTGNSILLRSVYIRGFVELNPAVTLDTRITIALVQDKQQVSDTSPTVAQMFTSTTDAQSTIQRDTGIGRFKILWRKTLVLTPGNNNAQLLQKYIKLYSHIRYNGTASSDIQKNGLYLVQINSESTHFPVATFNCRVGYHDN